MKAILLLFLTIFFTMNGFSQQFPPFNGNEIRKNTLVLKLKPEYKNFAHKGSIVHIDFENVCSILNVNSCSKSFPLHNSPISITNETGDSLVDISLWYQLEYQSNIKLDEAIYLMQSTGLFTYVEPRGQNSFLYTINDQKAGLQYYLNKVNAYQAWDIERGDSSVIIGIIDNGTDRVHEDMMKNLHYNYNDPIDGIDNDNDGYVDNFYGWDLGSNDNDPQWYPMGHGVFVSGITSATQNNGIGIAGIAYNNKYMPIKVDDTSGMLTHDYEGIIYAADHGCSVINCSWGSYVGGQYGQDIINYATFNQNALIVAAAGNSNNSQSIYPASYKYVISCAATDSLDQRASWASYGKKVDISAPGSFIYSTFINNMYVTSHGSSFSAPCVAAGAALLKSKYPWMSALQLGEQLKVTSDYIDTISSNIPYEKNIGYGRLNIYNALVDTTKPSFVLNNFQYSQSFDTLKLITNLKNYLHSSSTLCSAFVEVSSPYIGLINNQFAIGTVGMLDTISNISNPFRFQILPGIPINEEIEIKIKYIDTNYTGYEFFTIYLNKDFLDLDTNQIRISIANNSSLGFVNGKLDQGNGFMYSNVNKTLFSCGGLVVGNSNGKVSDNIYNEFSRSKDFRPIEIVKNVVPAQLGNKEIYCRYNDDSAQFSKLNIEVIQRSYAFNSSNLAKAIFLDYTIKNKGISSLNSLYAGLYIDWDLVHSETNRAVFNSQNKMSYTYSTKGGQYGAIMQLEGDSIYAYNFNHDGSDTSINIQDGFLALEKYEALQTNHFTAGFSHPQGKEVSSLLSNGPYILPSGDSIHVVFAIIVGDHLADLNMVAKNVRDYYYNTASIQDPDHITTIGNLVSFPNPTEENTDIYFDLSQSQTIEVELINMYGNVINSLPKQFLSAGNQKISIPLNSVSSGVYYIRLKTGNEQKVCKIVKL